MDHKHHQSLEWIKRIKALAEMGLVYTENDYDKERFEEMRTLSHQLMSVMTDVPLKVLEDFFLPQKDYPTPKVDIRGFILNEEKQVLLVKEGEDGRWSLPGGWGDVGYSPSEVIIKEIKEEAGLEAAVVRLLAVYDKKCHPHPPQPFYVYKLVFYCTVDAGLMQTSFDIEAARYFDIGQLPDLSEDRILKSQVEQLHAMVTQETLEVHID